MTEKELERQQPFFYWLYSITGIGDATIRRLLQKEKKPEAIFYADRLTLQFWRQEGVLSEKQVQALQSSRKTWELYTRYDSLLHAGIRFYPIYHPLYPGKLASAFDPPAALFVKGKLPENQKQSLAIIGARSCSGYGRRMAESFAGTLGEAGIQIISGMARGIDGIAQSAALRAGGASFGVLGCGVDICYPSQNREIYQQLIKQGGVISSYLPKTMPKPQYFPPRNRIISGLADALLVIEAREKSGTLITVDMALEQGREVYALPGRVADPVSEGCNRLISQGAGIVLSPQELLAELTGNRQTGAARPEEKRELDEREKRIYAVLEDDPKSPEAIRREVEGQTGAAPALPEVMDTLVKLCMKGAVRQERGGYCVR